MMVRHHLCMFRKNSMIAGIEPKIIKFEFHDGGLEGRCDYELETYKLNRKVFQMFSLACVSVKL